jgi:ketopantoate reductase
MMGLDESASAIRRKDSPSASKVASTSALPGSGETSGTRTRRSMLAWIIASGASDVELEAVVGAVVELGRLTGTPAPGIGAVYACAALLADTLGKHRGRLNIAT